MLLKLMVLNVEGKAEGRREQYGGGLKPLLPTNLEKYENKFLCHLPYLSAIPSQPIIAIGFLRRASYTPACKRADE